MPTPFEHTHYSGHSADDVWRGINTPLLGDLALAINPLLDAHYEELNTDGQIGQGTRIIYAPSKLLVNKVPSALRSMVPLDISFRVEEYNPEDRTRLDVLESRKAEGTVRHTVTASESGKGFLVVEGELSISGLASIAEGPAIEQGIYEPNKRLLEYLPEVLAS
jgi:hypothetical protein